MQKPEEPVDKLKPMVKIEKSADPLNAPPTPPLNKEDEGSPPAKKSRVNAEQSLPSGSGNQQMSRVQNGHRTEQNVNEQMQNAINIDAIVQLIPRHFIDINTSDQLDKNADLGPVYPCSLCNKHYYGSIIYFEFHMAGHATTRHNCIACGKHYPTMCDYESHLSECLSQFGEKVLKELVNTTYTQLNTWLQVYRLFAARGEFIRKLGYAQKGCEMCHLIESDIRLYKLQEPVPVRPENECNRRVVDHRLHHQAYFRFKCQYCFDRKREKLSNPDQCSNLIKLLAHSTVTFPQKYNVIAKHIEKYHQDEIRELEPTEIMLQRYMFVGEFEVRFVGRDYVVGEKDAYTVGECRKIADGDARYKSCAEYMMQRYAGIGVKLDEENDDNGHSVQEIVEEDDRGKQLDQEEETGEQVCGGEDLSGQLDEEGQLDGQLGEEKEQLHGD